MFACPGCNQILAGAKTYPIYCPLTNATYMSDMEDDILSGNYCGSDVPVIPDNGHCYSLRPQDKRITIVSDGRGSSTKIYDENGCQMHSVESLEFLPITANELIRVRLTCVAPAIIMRAEEEKVEPNREPLRAVDIGGE